MTSVFKMLACTREGHTFEGDLGSSEIGQGRGQGWEHRAYVSTVRTYVREHRGSSQLAYSLNSLVLPSRPNGWLQHLSPIVTVTRSVGGTDFLGV